MPLDISTVVSGQVIQATHVTQFYNLLTGVMTDQPVTLKNQLTVGGNQGTGSVPLTVSAVASTTVDMFDVKNSAGVVQLGVSSTGAVTLANGLTVSAGGLTVTAGGLTVSAGNLTMSGAQTLFVANIGDPSTAHTVLNVTNPGSSVSFFTISGAAAGGNLTISGGGTATSISFRNNANNADNLIITDAGALTLGRTSGGQAIQNNAATGRLWLQDRLTIASAGLAQLVTSLAGANGLVFIVDGGGRSAIIMCTGGNHTTQILAQSGTVFTTVSGTANSWNVYWSAGNSRFEVQNLTGSSQALDIISFTGG